MAGIMQYWRDGNGKFSVEEKFWDIYQTDLNLRIRPAYFLSHEFGHRFEQELYKKQDDYHGIITNKLRTVHSVYLDNITIRS